MDTAARAPERVAAVRDTWRIALLGLALAGGVATFLAAARALQRLAAEAEATMGELQRSRARIAAGAAEERRRIERDLHDGAQQRLVALRIELELAEDIVRQDPERGAARLRELEAEVDEALEELRALAHGVYPPVLADAGLAEALRSVAMRSAMRVDLVSHDGARYSTEVEGAVYFCVLEALQNAQKHATGARRVVVTLDGGPGEELRFSVRDDGAGAATIDEGAGITNMRDRLAAIGGGVDIASKPGVGTVVRGNAAARASAACAVGGPELTQLPRRELLLAHVGRDAARDLLRGLRDLVERDQDHDRSALGGDQPGAPSRSRPSRPSVRRAARDRGAGLPPAPAPRLPTPPDRPPRTPAWRRSGRRRRA